MIASLIPPLYKPLQTRSQLDLPKTYPDIVQIQEVTCCTNYEPMSLRALLSRLHAALSRSKCSGSSTATTQDTVGAPST